MFRKLFAIETAALQQRAEEMLNRVEDGESRLGDMVRETFGTQSPFCPGMWAMRSPV